MSGLFGDAGYIIPFIGKDQQAVLLQGFLIVFGHLAIHAPRQDDNDAALASEQYLQYLFLHLRVKTADHSHFLPLADLRCPIQYGQYGERSDRIHTLQAEKVILKQWYDSNIDNRWNSERRSQVYLDYVES